MSREHQGSQEEAPTPRLSQYLSRLYAMEENAALRDGLREALAARWDGDERLKRLPKGVRDALAR